MYKKVLKVAFIIAIVLVAGINVFNAQKPTVLSDVAKENVEALAACEDMGYYTAYREYTAENGCYCLHCPEPKDTSCTCW